MPALTFAGPPGAIDELGIWTPVHAAGDVALLWQQDLSGVAPATLPPIAAAARALPQAENRAAIFASTRGYAAGVAPEFAGPERDLAAWARLAPADPDALRLLPDFRAAAEQVAAFFEKVRAALRNYARIVTTIDTATVAVTEVTWTGHFRAAWAPGLPVSDAARHQAAVTLALRTRDLWLRLAATVLAAAAQLAALFAANPLLAVPAAYRFARQVIEQAQMLMLA